MARARCGDDGALRITEDGTELDLGDAVLDGRERDDVAPEAYRGIGIQVIGARNVTIRGGRLRGYRVAVQAMDAPGLRLLGVNADEGRRDRLASTPAREASEDWLWPHHDDDDEWAKRYGAGFSLTRCDLAHVEGCEARRGQNGLLLASSRRVRIVGNDFAWNSGWGVALWRASENIIAWNVLDHCVRGMSPGVYFRGQDSAAILLFEQCCSNVVYRNHATHSGDGLFLYAGHETTQRTGRGGSNHNVVVDNDFRFAVANGIEATFSTGNVFAGNDVSGSDHGVWAGYSRDTLIVEQRAVDCMTAGISIEHGVGNRIVGNEIEGGRHGIHLWWDDDKELLAGPYGQQQDTRSADNTIEGNTIRGSEIALRLVQDEGSTVRWNDLGASAVGLQLEGTTRPRELAFNRFVGTRRRRGEAPRALQAPDGFALDPATRVICAWRTKTDPTWRPWSPIAPFPGPPCGAPRHPTWRSRGAYASRSMRPWGVMRSASGPTGRCNRPMRPCFRIAWRAGVAPRCSCSPPDRGRCAPRAATWRWSRHGAPATVTSSYARPRRRPPDRCRSRSRSACPVSCSRCPVSCCPSCGTWPGTCSMPIRSRNRSRSAARSRVSPSRGSAWTRCCSPGARAHRPACAPIASRRAHAPRSTCRRAAGVCA
ncbi:MAG: right-handed parallel beta-helix repeat-containing protein [Planctomycetota bacterium]